jgi:hypothetical protein
VTLHVVRFSHPDAPVFTCNICGREFYEHERRARVAHVNKCFEEHREEIAASQLANQPFFDPAKLGTKDIEDWLAEQDASGESNSDKVKRGNKRLS